MCGAPASESVSDAAEFFAELVLLARRGDKRAWRTLIDMCKPIIGTVARSYRLPGCDIDDVVQIVCLALFEHLGGIREPRAVPAWVITVARRESMRLVRGQRKVVLVDGFDEIDDLKRQDVDADLLRAELAQALRAGLTDLPRTQRTLLLLLTDGQQRSYREIGDLLAIPIGSIGPTRARGLARLRRSPTVSRYLAAS